jgi:hypothetical protein
MSTLQQPEQVQLKQQDPECITCKIIGSAAFAGVGIYALQMSRARAPGSVVGKTIMGGVGVCEYLFFESKLRLIGLWDRLFGS